MNSKIWLIIAFGLTLNPACNNTQSSNPSDEDIWKMGWRLIENSMDENFEMADSQFDSLLNITDAIDYKFLVTGLEVKAELNKENEIGELLKGQNEEMLRRLCRKDFLADFELCTGVTLEEVKDKVLQLELVKMHIDDQAVRGNLLQELIDKYNINVEDVTLDGMRIVDERNRNRLKEIIREKGFPTKELVGSDAMSGVFLIIQHADRDKEWQSAQLSKVEKAVKKGDLDGQSFAYLYDRIKKNASEKQRYGTQFSKVDPVNKIVELADTEDIQNLDNRRREVGMMPIDMYKRLMLKSI